MTRHAWILWLMLALLPLRGWAASVLPIPSTLPSAMSDARTGPAEFRQHLMHSGQAPAAAAPTSRVDAAATHAPCHGTAAGQATAGHATCVADCDLCHGGFVPMQPAALACPDLPTAAPETLPARDTGRRLVGGLERPPRHAALLA